jgi:sugar lactone lactonase YvrE
MVVAMFFTSPSARADKLFVGDDWGNNLYEFDTEQGEASKVVFCDHIKGVNGLAFDTKTNLYVSDYADGPAFFATGLSAGTGGGSRAGTAKRAAGRGGKARSLHFDGLSKAI